MPKSTNTSDTDLIDFITLKNLAAQQIAATLWNQDLWTPSLAKDKDPQLPPSKYVKTLRKAKSLELPQALKQLLYQRIISMGHQISKWMNHVYLALDGDCWGHHDIYWTVWGSIDVERIIKDRMEKPGETWTKLKWACQHSFYDAIPTLHQQLSPELQTRWSMEVGWDDHFNETSLDYWTLFLEDPQISECDYNERMILEALKSGNLAAVKYFWYMESAETHVRWLKTTHFFAWINPSAMFFSTAFSFFEQVLTEKEKMVAIMACCRKGYNQLATQYAKGCPREEFFSRFLVTIESMQAIDWCDMMEFILKIVELESKIMVEFDEKVPFTWRHTFKVLWPRKPLEKPFNKLLVNFMICLLMMEDFDYIKYIVKDVKDIDALRSELEMKLSAKPFKYKSLLESIFNDVLQNKKV